MRLRTVERAIRMGLQILNEQGGVILNSITEITYSDVRFLAVYLAHKSALELSYQRMILVYMRAFYEYTARLEHCSCTSPFKYISLPRLDLHPTKPIERDTLFSLDKNLSEIPLHTRLAFLLAVVTGARANSICRLTTEDLFYSDSGYTDISIVESDDN